MSWHVGTPVLQRYYTVYRQREIKTPSVQVVPVSGTIALKLNATEAVEVKTPHNELFVAELKSSIPYSERIWDPAGRVWFVAKEHLKTVQDLVEKYFPVVKPKKPMKVRDRVRELVEQKGKLVKDTPYYTVYEIPPQMLRKSDKFRIVFQDGTFIALAKPDYVFSSTFSAFILAYRREHRLPVVAEIYYVLPKGLSKVYNTFKWFGIEKIINLSPEEVNQLAAVIPHVSERDFILYEPYKELAKDLDLRNPEQVKAFFKLAKTL